MARIIQSYSMQKAIAVGGATQQIQFSPGEIDGAGAILVTLVMQQTAGVLDLNDIGRVRLKANNQTVIDVTVAELLAYQERFSPKGASDLLTGRVLNIPLCALDAEGGDDACDAWQWMVGASMLVEVTMTPDAAAAGIMMITLTKTTVEPAGYITLIGQPMNVLNAQTNANVPLGAPGLVQGVGIVTANLRELRLILGGLEVASIFGGSFNGLANLGDAMQGCQALWDAPDDASNQTGVQFIKTAQGLPANPNTSKALVTSSAGMATTDEIVLYTVVPYDQSA